MKSCGDCYSIGMRESGYVRVDGKSSEKFVVERG